MGAVFCFSFCCVFLSVSAVAKFRIQKQPKVILLLEQDCRESENSEISSWCDETPVQLCSTDFLGEQDCLVIFFMGNDDK